MIGIVSLAFGLVTPPYGLCLMICCSIAGMRLSDVLKDVMMMLLPMIGVLALVIVWPQTGPVPAEPDLAGIPEVALSSRKLAWEGSDADPTHVHQGGWKHGAAVVRRTRSLS